MSLRKVTVISSARSQPKIFNSEANTWEELKDNLSDFGNVNDMKAVVKETKVSLEQPEAQLPDSDFTLYLTPKKIKAGGVDIAEALKSLRDKQSEAFDQVIAEVEAGDYDNEDDDEGDDDDDFSVVSSKKAIISEEDRAFMKAMSQG